MPKIRRLDKLPKRKVTIDELLDRDEIISAIDDVIADKDDMDEFMGIYVKDGSIYWRCSGLSVSRQIYLMEGVRFSLLDNREE